MPTFRYSAFRGDGSPVSGIMETETYQDALHALRAEGLHLRELSETADATGWRRSR